MKDTFNKQFFLQLLLHVLSQSSLRTLSSWMRELELGKWSCLCKLIQKVFCLFYTISTSIFTLPPQDVDFNGVANKASFIWFLAGFCHWPQQEIRAWQERVILQPPSFGIFLEVGVTLRVASSPFSMSLALHQMFLLLAFLSLGVEMASHCF